jgi:hypothetical protein
MADARTWRKVHKDIIEWRGVAQQAGIRVQ